jgi:hypothetical protein
VYPIYTGVKYRVSSKAREQLFTGFYRDNIWGDPESVSGSGSSLAGSAKLRQALPGGAKRRETAVGQLLHS